jgi:hypothetical protein
MEHRAREFRAGWLSALYTIRVYLRCKAALERSRALCTKSTMNVL